MQINSISISYLHCDSGTNYKLKSMPSFELERVLFGRFLVKCCSSSQIRHACVLCTLNEKSR